MKIHGDCTRIKRTRLHNIWQNMRQRCNNPTRDTYAFYGAKGTTICATWDSFIAFRTWALANGYAANLTLDRKNTHGNYNPSNCRWVTKTVQSRNQKAYQNCYSKYRGVTWGKANKKWLAQISIANKNRYIGSFDDEIVAAKARDNYIDEHNLKHFIKNF